MIYSVDGNVHVGKSTFIKKFAQENNLCIIDEIKFPNETEPYKRQLSYIQRRN